MPNSDGPPPKGQVRTRFVGPRANPAHIARRCLREKLDLARNRKLTLVTAPSGYGKTTAVHGWLEAAGLPSAWLTLDEGDIAPMVFWEYVFTTLDHLVPWIGEDLAYVFSSAELVQADVQVNVLIDHLSDLRQDSFLVVDCAEPLSNPVVLKGLAFFLDYLPAFMHLVLIGRVEPMLDLARFELKSQLLRIGQRDLRFSAEEISDFFARRGRPLDDADVHQVERFSEGWAAALVAVTMSFEEEADPRDVVSRLSRCHESIDRYLIEQVVGTWQPDKKSFLLETSVLDTLDADSCDAVTGRSNARRMLAELDRRSEFLTIIDEDAQVFRYHPLFRHVLLRLLIESDSGCASTLHSRAADWYLGKGLVLQAIPHYLDAGRYETACALFERESMALAGRNDIGMALTWLDRLPGPVRDGSPWLAVFQAFSHAKDRRFDLARGFFARALALADVDPQVDWAGPIRTLVGLGTAYLLIGEGRIDELLPLLRNLPPAASWHPDTRGYFDFNRTDVHFYRCDIGNIARLVGEREQSVQLLVSQYQNLLAVMPGYLPLAEGEFHYETGRPDEALPRLVDALEAGQTAKCPGVLVPAMVDLVRIRRISGDFAGVDRLLSECMDRLKDMDGAHWIYLVQACRARYALEAGRLDIALEWAECSRLSVYGRIHRAHEYELLVYARVLAATGRREDAELLLARLLAFAQAERRRHSEVEARNLLAILAYRKNQVEKAVELMERALAIGLEDGFLRLFLDEGDPILGVLKQTAAALRKKMEPHEALLDYVRSMVARLQEELRNQAHELARHEDDPRVHHLTAKERQVLELLVAAFTNEEIGERLRIGLRTVKAHTGSIYDKLGVRNRAQCIKYVLDRHLLE